MGMKYFSGILFCSKVRGNSGLAGRTAAKASGAAPHSLSALEFNFVQRNARVAKLADARDLKSRVPHGTCGFDSRPGHQDFSSLPLSKPRLFLFVQPQAIGAVAVKPVVVLASHVSAARTDMRLLVGLHHAELKAVHAVRTPSREISGQSNCGGTHRLPLSSIEVFRCAAGWRANVLPCRGWQNLCETKCNGSTPNAGRVGGAVRPVNVKETSLA